MNHNKVIGTYKSKKGRKVELIQNDGSLEFGVYCYGPNNYHILWDFEIEGIPRFGKSKKEDWIKAILDGRVDKAYEKDESRMDRNIYSAKGFEFDSLKKDSNMKIKDESLNSKIKAWFLKAHPEEEYFGKQLNANATFQGLYETIKNKQNVYNYIGLQDSVVREYIFQELADILHQNYQMIYKMWLGDSMKDAKYDKETKQGFPIIAKYIDGGRIHVIAKRARDYIIGLGYDENSGTWNQGRYDLPTFEKAENALFEEKGKLRRMGDSLKRYKIGNRIITADSATKALEIHKLLDSKMKDAEYYIDKRHANREARMNGYSSFKNMAKDYGITIPWENSEQYELAGNKSDVLDFLHDYFDEDYYSIEDSIKNSDSISDGYYSEYDKKDKEFVKMALSEMKRYERNWNGMSSQDKRNVGCTLGELRKRIKELEEVKDSISDSKVEDSDQTDIFNEIKSKYPGVKFVNVAYEKENFEGKTIGDFSFNIIGNLPNGLNRFDLTKKEPFERFVKWVMEKHGYRQVNVSTDSFRNELRVIAGGFKSIKDSISDESIEELSEEERQAIEDYKKAIAETNDPKMLKLFAHILKEETEHLEELQTGEMEDSFKD